MRRKCITPEFIRDYLESQPDGTIWDMNGQQT